MSAPTSDPHRAGSGSPIDEMERRRGSDSSQSQGQHEMRERSRSTSRSRLLPLRRPSMPSVLGDLRNPIVGRLRGRAEEGDGTERENSNIMEEVESPKTPRFRLGMPTLPSTRLHLPHLTRTWTTGSNGPESRPSTARAAQPELRRETLPAIAVSAVDDGGVARLSPAAHAGTTQGRARGASPLPSPSVPAHTERSSNATVRGQEQQRPETSQVETPSTLTSPRRTRRRCLPGIRSQQVRSHILRCVVSGISLILLLSICR